MSELIEFDQQPYEVPEQTWQELQEQINYLVPKIEANEPLSPDDFKSVQHTAKQVREFGQNYNRQITTAARNYKDRLDEELSKIGYSVIEQYVATKRQEQQQSRSQILNEKITQFNNIMTQALANTEAVKYLSVASAIGNAFLSRFPKINSAAKNAEIKSWVPIEAVIKNTLVTVDNVLKQYPVIITENLPATARSVQQIMAYIRDGQDSHLENMDANLQLDQPLIEKSQLKKLVHNPKEACDLITSVLGMDITDELKLNRIQMVLNTLKQY